MVVTHADITVFFEKTFLLAPTVMFFVSTNTFTKFPTLLENTERKLLGILSGKCSCSQLLGAILFRLSEAQGSDVHWPGLKSSPFLRSGSQEFQV